MNGVLGMARLLYETETPPRATHLCRSHRAVRRGASGLDRDILDFSRSSRHADSGRRANHIRALIEGLSSFLGTCPYQRHRTDRFCRARGSPSDSHRQHAVQQVLTNLVGNAVKFTEKGGVRIDACMIVERERNYLRFEVRDTGVGVPAEKRKEIFDEFVQADSARPQIRRDRAGPGICRRLVEAMGGRNRVDAG